MNIELQKIIKSWQDYAAFEVDSASSRTLHIQNLSADLVHAFIGVRRSGKTTLALQTALQSKKIFLYINFEDPYFSQNKTHKVFDEIIVEFVNLYNKKPELIIFDEIQNILNWERWTRKHIDQKKSQLIITGSSSKMLSSELSSSLTGRNLTMEVWPLSFSEFLRFNVDSKNTKTDLQLAFNEFVHYGAFPRIVLEKNIHLKKELLKQYYTDSLFKDVVQRNEIRDVNSLVSVYNFCLTNIAKLHSYTSLKNAFGLSTQAPINYLKFLEEAYLLFNVKIYNKNLKVQNRHPRKIYTIDTGFRNVNATSNSDDFGCQLENAVFLEFKKMGFEIYYHKNKFECDFILCENYKVKQAIQVCESLLDNEKTKDREINGLIEAMKVNKLKTGLIITRNDEAKLIYPEGEIQIIPAWKYFTKVFENV